MSQIVPQTPNRMFWSASSRIIKTLVSMKGSLEIASTTAFEKFVSQSPSDWSAVQNYFLSTSLKTFFSQGNEFMHQLCLIEKTVLETGVTESTIKEQLKDLFEKFKAIPYSAIMVYKNRIFENPSIGKTQHFLDQHYGISQEQTIFERSPLLADSLQLSKQNQEDLISYTYINFSKAPLEVNSVLEKLHSQRVDEDTQIDFFFRESKRLLKNTLISWRVNPRFQQLILSLFGIPSEILEHILVTLDIAEENNSLEKCLEQLRIILDLVDEKNNSDLVQEPSVSALLDALETIIGARTRQGKIPDLSSKVKRMVFIISLDFSELETILRSLQLAVDPKDVDEDTIMYISEKMEENAKKIEEYGLTEKNKIMGYGIAEKDKIIRQIEKELQLHFSNPKIKLKGEETWRYVQGLGDNDPTLIKISRILGDPQGNFGKTTIQQKIEDLLKSLAQSSEDDLKRYQQLDQAKIKLDKFLDILLLYVFSPIGAIFDVTIDYFSWMSINLEIIRQTADLNAFQQFKGKKHIKFLLEAGLALFHVPPDDLTVLIASILSQSEYSEVQKQISNRSYLYRQFSLERKFSESIRHSWTRVEEIWVCFLRFRKSRLEIEEKVKKEQKVTRDTADQIYAEYESILLNYRRSANLQIKPNLLSEDHEKRLLRLFEKIQCLDPNTLFQEKIRLRR
ncbi:MAG: hypothetical protein ACFFBD_16995, partial [Candidatus Hodarchaeota archaeon]